MAAPEIHEPPHEQLRRLLAEGRAEGRSFETLWREALGLDRSPVVTRATPDPPDGVVIWPRDTAMRRWAMRAVIDTRAAWFRAFHRLPAPRREASVAMLGAALSALAAVEPPEGKRSTQHRVLELLRDSEPLTTKQIASRLRLNENTARHALSALRGLRQITHLDGTYTIGSDDGTPVKSGRIGVAPEILALLADGRPRRRGEIVEEVGATPSGVTRVLSRLVAAGMLVRTDNGAYVPAVEREAIPA